MGETATKPGVASKEDAWTEEFFAVTLEEMRAQRADSGRQRFAEALAPHFVQFQTLLAFTTVDVNALAAQQELAASHRAMTTAEAEPNYATALARLNDAAGHATTMQNALAAAKLRFELKLAGMAADRKAALAQETESDAAAKAKEDVVKADAEMLKLEKGPDFAAAERLLIPLAVAIGKLKTAVAADDKKLYEDARAALVTDEGKALLIGDKSASLREAAANLAGSIAAVKEAVDATEYAKARKLLATLRDDIAKALAADVAYKKAKSDYDTEMTGVGSRFAEANRKQGQSSDYRTAWGTLVPPWNARIAAKNAEDFPAALDKLRLVLAALDTFDALDLAQPAKIEAANRIKDEIDSLDAKRLKAMSLKDKGDKMKVLLSADTDVGPPPSEIRKAYQKLVLATDMDPAFVKQENKFYDTIGKDLAKVPEVKDARKGWASKSRDDKLKAIRAVIKAQSDALGFPPPEVVPEDTPPEGGLTTNGYFNPSDGKIYINFNGASSVHDFSRAVDLALHENAHNWQDKLVKKLQAGQLPPTDPNYQQTVMFIINDMPGAYIDGNENFEAYKKQPMEDHSHAVGPRGASALTKKLSSWF